MDVQYQIIYIWGRAQLHTLIIFNNVGHHYQSMKVTDVNEFSENLIRERQNAYTDR